MRVVLAIFAILVLNVTAHARDIYVDNIGGDDQRDGSSALPQGTTGGPTRSIRKALHLAEGGDRIILIKTEAPYRESITLQASRHSGTADRPFRIIGNGAILDGTQPVPPRAWESLPGNLFRFRPRRLNHHLLYLEGKPAPRVTLESAEELVNAAPGSWSTVDNFVYFFPGPNRGPDDYTLTFTALPVGITLYEVHHVEIMDLFVQGFQLDGINAHDDASEVTLVGVNCRGNGRSGISVGGSSRVVIRSCVAGNNGTAQVRTEGESRTQIFDSQILDNTAPAIVRDGGYVTMKPDRKIVR